MVYKNNAGSQAVEPNLVLLTDSFANIKIGDYAAPCVYDANFDGVNDIIVGDIFGSLHLYEGTNSGGTLSYTTSTTSLGNVMVGGNNYAYGYAAPYVGRIDNVIQKQLIVGTGDGTIERYDSLQWGITSTYKKIDSTYSYIKTPFRAVPTAADIDKDGYYDLMIGNKMGGILYYRQQLLFPASGQIDDDTIIGTPASVGSSGNLVLCNVYPNPASNVMHINHTFDAAMQLNIYNAYGALVLQEKYNNQKDIILPITALANGIYSYRITSAGKIASGKFAVQKSN
jgi:Secretion system C-terminal sorting domain